MKAEEERAKRASLQQLLSINVTVILYFSNHILLKAITKSAGFKVVIYLKKPLCCFRGYELMNYKQLCGIGTVSSLNKHSVQCSDKDNCRMSVETDISFAIFSIG